MIEVSRIICFSNVKIEIESVIKIITNKIRTISNVLWYLARNEYFRCKINIIK